jgi:cytoskeletal protein CcmA (bactofilin family)
MSTNDQAAPITVIAEGSRFNGAVESTCGVEVRGRVQGEIASPSLVVTVTGVVQGNVKVGGLRSHGELSGTIEAESIELSGRVSDDTVLRAQTLNVKPALVGSPEHVTFGDCVLEIGEVTDKSASPSGGSGKGRRKKNAPSADATDGGEAPPEE